MRTVTITILRLEMVAELNADNKLGGRAREELLLQHLAVLLFSVALIVVTEENQAEKNAMIIIRSAEMGVAKTALENQDFRVLLAITSYLFAKPTSMRGYAGMESENLKIPGENNVTMEISMQVMGVAFSAE